MRERRRADARRREHQMIAVLTVSIAVAFAAVTFLPATEDAATEQPAPPPTASSAPATAMAAATPAPTIEAAPAARAAADLASYDAALSAGDRVGAFDHLAADLQAQVGGFDRFDDLWSAVGAVRTDAAECQGPDPGGVVRCRSVVEVEGIGGACTRSTALTDLALIGTRYRIVGQALEPGGPCTARPDSPPPDSP